MSVKISILEAVRLAKEAMGIETAEELAAWIATYHGLTVKPVIVKVMLGALQEREHLEQIRLKAMELAATMPAGLPQKKPADCPGPTPAVECPKEPKAEKKPKPSLGIRGCPECQAEDYVFRGRKKDKPQEGETGSVIVTKFHCRDCGHQWKVRRSE